MGQTESDGPRDLDQEWGEFTDEIRVILPGVQVLFAFLLTVPFSARFGEVSAADRALFFVAFLCAALASILLIAPSIYHRLEWRRRDKEHVLQAAQRFVLAGSAFLAAAMAAAVFLTADFLYGATWGAPIAGGVTGLILVLWYVLPLARRLVRSPEPCPTAPDGARSGARRGCSNVQSRRCTGP